METGRSKCSDSNLERMSVGSIPKCSILWALQVTPAVLQNIHNNIRCSLCHGHAVSVPMPEMGPKHAHAQNLWVCDPTWKKEILQMWLRTSSWEIILVYPGGPSLNAWVLKNGETFPTWSVSRRCSISGFEDRGKATRQGMWMISKSWKRPGKGFSPKASRKEPALQCWPN